MIQSLSAELKKSIHDLDVKTTELILSSHDEMISFDPTNGTRYEGVSTVVSRMFDEMRVYALFAQEYDDMKWTAEQWDKWMNSNNARHFDLGFTYPRFNDTFKGVK